MQMLEVNNSGVFVVSAIDEIMQRSPWGSRGLGPGADGIRVKKEQSSI